MPLRDHFRPPVSSRSSWEGFHAQWPAMIVLGLFDKLPKNYVAEPRVHLGRDFEIDVGSFSEEEGGTALLTPEENGAVAAWSPTKPTFAVETDVIDADEYEVRVYDVERARRLVAAVEIVSPGNKDRPETRQQFVGKCAALLQQRVSVIVIDLVTVRHFNLYAELLDSIGQSDPTLGDKPPNIYAAVCRWRENGKRNLLETWTYPLVLGQALPTLPLWLDNLAIPLELEKSYEQTCRALHIA